jgi:hypothetical protein
MVFVARAEAVSSTFTDRIAWQTAVGAGITTIGFEGIAPQGGQLSSAHLVLSGVDFGAATVAGPGIGSYISAWGTGAMLYNYGLFAPVTIVFATPVKAFGFSYGATCTIVASCPSGAVNFTLSSGETFHSSGPLPPMQFVGVISNVPLTSVTLQITPTLPILDNFSFAPSVLPEPASSNTRVDFNKDGMSDIAWQHADGSAAMWLMNGLNATSTGDLLGAGTGWSVKQIGDFNGDGMSDILWQHTDGTAVMWLMNGLNAISAGGLLGAGTGWSVNRTGDFNGDGMSDIVWQHSDGSIAAWLMSGLQRVSGGGLLGPGSGWSPVPSN